RPRGRSIQSIRLSGLPARIGEVAVRAGHRVKVHAVARVEQAVKRLQRERQVERRVAGGADVERAQGHLGVVAPGEVEVAKRAEALVPGGGVLIAGSRGAVPSEPELVERCALLEAEVGT